MINHNGKDFKKERVCVCDIHIIDSLCCTAEINTENQLYLKKVPHNHRLNNINIFKVFEIKLSNCSTRIIKEREASPERIRDLSLEIG